MPVGRGSSTQLAPKGLPHGEKKKQVALMRQAGLPLEPSAPRSAPAPQPGVGAAPPQQPRAPFDALGSRAPTQPLDLGGPLQEVAPSAVQQFKEVALQSENPVLRRIAENL